jgi:integrase/recombinase XerD
MSRPKKLPEVLDEKELESLIASDHGHKATKLRNLSMIRLMANTGLRASELLGLRIRDINFNTGKLKVRQGKGGKDRILYLKDDDLKLVREYLGRRINTNDFVFVGKNGNPIQARYLRAMVKKAGIRAGVAKDIHPHILRHTFATDLYRSTKNLRLTQVALGHSSITTTEIYTHVAPVELEEAMKGLRD